jgi:hypothetical protein
MEFADREAGANDSHQATLAMNRLRLALGQDVLSSHFCAVSQ